ncbi:hypothetical protein PV08_02375 [Exophiala spinifera]|uniref:Tautomerase cis-CaaD-like domain-containing protein n=1 Tax=Exophiala spinifera TaxID=91928 RepID=A0A0D2BGI0_9EURO|nr:uncharacterized protein PV08_02375 [Exophiala spinifera]KIW18088.1 hypothetical protein PV08_02375 [Exophiala spinifera]
MPLYEIEHCVPLSRAERDELARAITEVHTRKFSTPSLFVNIKFTSTEVAEDDEEKRRVHLYIAGKERSVNRILGFVRGGGPRTPTHLGELAQQIQDAWDRIINNGEKKKAGHDAPRELKVVAIVGSLAAGIENGFLLPPAGEDAAWLKTHRADFEKLAATGDPDFTGLVEEMRTREDLVRELEKSA